MGLVVFRDETARAARFCPLPARVLLPILSPVSTHLGPSTIGFTLLEVLVALVVFAVGVLGLTAEAASLTRALARARRGEEVAVAAASRLERLRAGACGTRADGRTPVVLGAATIADLEWRWSAAGDSSYGLHLVVTPASAPAPQRLTAETLATVIACR